MKKIAFTSALFLTACVTINIYFPAAAAEKVADEIIREIQQEENPPAKPEQNSPESDLTDWQINAFQLLDRLITVMIPPVHAGSADLAVDSAEIRQVRATMRARYRALKPFYSQGLIGIGSDGMLVVRGHVPLSERNKVNKLVAAENADRNRLYQAIARANGHPGWFEQIKATFATRWIRHAKPGWWYQAPNGSWMQK